MNLNLKCYVRLNPNWRSLIPAILICIFPESTENVGKRQRMYNGMIDTSCGESYVSSYGIVKLLSLNKGGLYQIPLDCIEVVDDFDGRDRPQ